MNTVKAVLVAAMLAVAVAAIVDGTACQTEDSAYCIWWGPVQGNGGGAIVINLGR